MDLPLLLVVVLVSLALLMRIDRGIKLLERLVDRMDSTANGSDRGDQGTEE